MSIIDTPDYQRGVFNAQQLLNTVPGGTRTCTASLPTNCETLVICVSGSPVFNNTPAVVGVTSSLQYLTVPMPQPLGANVSTWFVDVSQVIDTSVTVTFAVTPAHTWYVYADCGSHIVADTSKLVSAGGVQFVIPTAPGESSGDRPPTELLYATGQWAANATLLAAAGGLFRYRIFAAHLTSATAGMVGELGDSAGSGTFLWGVGPAACALSFYPSGLPLSANGAVKFTLQAGTGNFQGGVVYTAESV